MLPRWKSLQQVGALPFAMDRDGAVLTALITTRRRRRWTQPKGWPVNGVSGAEAAAREAREEAGIIGPVGAQSLGAYDYVKEMRAGYRASCRVIVFPLLATTQLLDWKERRDRKLLWVPLAEAARRVDEPGLRRLLRSVAAVPDSLELLVRQTN